MTTKLSNTVACVRSHRQQTEEMQRLDYITDMILQMRQMADDLPRSSLQAILDAALIEARIQLARHQN